MEIYLINDTTSTIEIADLHGVNVSSGESLDIINLYSFERVARSNNLKTYVSNGDIIVNNGSANLSIENGIKHLTINTAYEAYVEVYKESDETVSTTTSTDWVQKLRLTTPSLNGTYRVFWYYEWQHSSASTHINVQMQVNDTITIMSHSQERTQKSGLWVPSSGFGDIENLSGVTNIDLDFSSSSNKANSSIRRARIEIMADIS